METTIEIDRREGTVKKTEGFWFFRKRQVYSLGGIDDVSLVEKFHAVEEGYVVTSYSIVLKDRDGAMVQLSTNDGQKALSLYREIREYLGLPENPAA